MPYLVLHVHMKSNPLTPFMIPLLHLSHNIIALVGSLGILQIQYIFSTRVFLMWYASWADQRELLYLSHFKAAEERFTHLTCIPHTEQWIPSMCQLGGIGNGK